MLTCMRLFCIISEYEICDEGKDFIVLSHDLDTSTTEDPPEEVPNVVDTSLDNNSPLVIILFCF